jgi:hypothetical protein
VFRPARRLRQKVILAGQYLPHTEQFEPSPKIASQGSARKDQAVHILRDSGPNSDDGLNDDLEWLDRYCKLVPKLTDACQARLRLANNDKPKTLLEEICKRTNRDVNDVRRQIAHRQEQDDSFFRRLWR